MRQVRAHSEPCIYSPGLDCCCYEEDRCPPWSNGCGPGQPHFDVAAPGFDNLQYSTANICGRAGTGFQSKEQSATLGTWYNQCSDISQCAQLCDQLPSHFQHGCKLFAAWGWKRGDPDNVKYRIVDCPRAFVDHVKNQFGSQGPAATGMGGSALSSPPCPQSVGGGVEPHKV